MERVNGYGESNNTRRRLCYLFECLTIFFFLVSIFLFYSFLFFSLFCIVRSYSRHTNDKLAADEVSLSHSIHMSHLRIHRQSFGTKADGKSKALSTDERSHSL